MGLCFIGLTLFLLFASFLSAQQAPTLKSTGAPIRVSFGCTEEELNWAGLTCSAEEACPIYLELSSVIPNGKKLVTAGNIHSASATLYSVLLTSEDSGESWQEPAKRIRGASLDQLQFYDFQNGWAAGETLYPLPRDPYFLITTDGGNSWSERSVTEEGGPGSVQRFWFDSAQHGELVIDRGKSGGSDRYALYESETGGGSWNIKATGAKMPVLRRSPPSLEHFDWRIRNSKDGKSYEIERRDGERWSAVAAFLVKVAECKASTTELTEPPPDEAENKEDKKDAVGEIKLKAPDPKKKKP